MRFMHMFLALLLTVKVMYTTVVVAGCAAGCFLV